MDICAMLSSRKKVAPEKQIKSELVDDFPTSEIQLAEFQEAFRLFDLDGDGAITMTELGDVLRSMGQNPSQEQLGVFFRNVDKNNNGMVDFPEFLTLMAEITQARDPEAEILEAFKMFDANGDGLVDGAELRAIMKSVTKDENITEDEINELIFTSDSNGDGKIDYEEFKAMME
mmetsp:Transcript_44682/g.100869  ORF Transcript_44682/g.100869 Transcript_44682/m.100869 type:complete len:174 (+) Transcript_44682:193-714(+)|eukprot:CAMPEP_0172620106 /NCGR_PEP_ID=MMETSP1068-20121228/100243_1 /TAXON_ID=35684 /ORGANISM="Pseudopedinella elastica, Strain CCMP716" /LENGTH=173 /DNA_ID=CAMNT_0013427211 /DNA_START=114 /DNA_END=635 /DNA_ORIENTATION=-